MTISTSKAPMARRSRADRAARRAMRRVLVRESRATARRMIRTGDFDAMATFDRAVRRTIPTR